jgi:hypothetical protein
MRPPADPKNAGRGREPTHPFPRRVGLPRSPRRPRQVPIGVLAGPAEPPSGRRRVDRVGA